MSTLFIDAVAGATQGLEAFRAEEKAKEEKQYARDLTERKMDMEQARLDESLASSRQSRDLTSLKIREIKKDTPLEDQKRALMSKEMERNAEIQSLQNQYRIGVKAAEALYRMEGDLTQEGKELFIDWAKTRDISQSLLGSSAGGGGMPSEIDYKDVLDVASKERVAAESVGNARSELTKLQRELTDIGEADPQMANLLNTKIKDQQELVRSLENNHANVKRIFESVKSNEMPIGAAAARVESLVLNAESLNAAAVAKQREAEEEAKEFEKALFGAGVLGVTGDEAPVEAPAGPLPPMPGEQGFDDFVENSPTTTTSDIPEDSKPAIPKVKRAGRGGQISLSSDERMSMFRDYVSEIIESRIPEFKIPSRGPGGEIVDKRNKLSNFVDKNIGRILQDAGGIDAPRGAILGAIRDALDSRGVRRLDVEVLSN